MTNPDTSRPRWRSLLTRWMLPLSGFLALCWFLVRVLPKPSRAAYPCQRAAFPMAATFVLWILGFWGMRRAWSHARAAAAASRLTTAGLCAALAGVFAVAFVASGPRSEALAAAPTDHQPVGVGRGVMPGRVVWMHAPAATDWAGKSSGKYWDDPACTHQPTVQVMLDRAVTRLAEADSVAGAWDAMFRHFNTERGRGEHGYQPGEKIAIKVNLTHCNAGMPTLDSKYDWNMSQSWIAAYRWDIQNSPQLVLALIRQLVYEVGVAEADICLGDPVCQMPNMLYNPIHAEFPEVVFFENKGGTGRLRTEFSEVEMHWGSPAAEGKEQDYIPTCFAEADYLINHAIPKSHTFGGITASAKNHFGSLIRTPTGSLRGSQENYFNLHSTLVNPAESDGQPGFGQYRCLVDLTGHPELGGKTILYIHDALFSGQGWDGIPFKWEMAPFNDDWPNSVFVSMDPVAIDSVAFDFLRTEWPEKVLDAAFEGGAEDYLHEAAQAHNPPSGSFYDPAGTGHRLASLGAHEHWNNATDKQYSRNRGLHSGIELVQMNLNDAAPEPRPALRSFVAFGKVRLHLTGLIPGRKYTLERVDPVTGAATAVAPYDTVLYGARWTGDVPAGNVFYRVRQR